MLENILTTLFFACLAVASVQDVLAQSVPDRYSAFITVLAFLRIFLVSDKSIVNHLCGSLAVSVPMLVFIVVLPGSFGGADVKIAGAGGLFLGIELVVRGTEYGILFAGMYSLLLLVCMQGTKWRKQQIPFIPFLSGGVLLALFFRS